MDCGLFSGLMPLFPQNAGMLTLSGNLSLISLCPFFLSFLIIALCTSTFSVYDYCAYILIDTHSKLHQDKNYIPPSFLFSFSALSEMLGI